jgi:kynurenine formamidase
MKTTVTVDETLYEADLTIPIDISIPLRAGKTNVLAWYAQPPTIEPVKNGAWIGEVKQGGSVNFRNIFFNPHAHGTHTECVGHITEAWISLNQQLKQFFFSSKLISITPTRVNGDAVIQKDAIEKAWNNAKAASLIIRTLPNSGSKTNMHYSNTNPPYLAQDAAAWMVEQNIQHLLIDLPSVDREQDDGKLQAHRAFWNVEGTNRMHCTITELIYVPPEITDGLYLLNLQITALENDASPSKPVLFKLNKIESSNNL